MQAWWAAVLTVSLVAAGCIGEVDEEAQGPSADGAPASLLTGAPTEGELAARGLDQAPELRLGEWWNVSVTSELDGQTREGTIVVAGLREGSYMVGMPSESFSHGLMIMHLPAIGPVDPATLGYEAHDVTFEPIQFPLTPGATWSTGWFTEPVDAEVVAATDGQATVELVGQNTHMTVTYDPALGLPAAISVEGYASMEVQDHGFGYEGEVVVPWDHDLILFHGRAAAGLDLTLQPGPPVESLTVEGDYTDASVALITGSAVAPGTPGYYEVTATTPEGQTLQKTQVTEPGNDGSLETQIHGVPHPAGTWEMEYRAGGGGVAFIEGVAYEAIDVTLRR